MGIRVFVRQSAIRRNEAGERPRQPVIAVCRGDRTDMTNEVDIAVENIGTVARLVYRPDRPLDPSGATVYLELLDGCEAYPVTVQD